MRSIPALALASCVVATGLPPTEARADRRDSADRFTVYADVVDVRPIYREVRVIEPHRECWTEYESRTVTERGRAPRRTRGAGDALVGGAIGGVIGNRLGRGASDGARAGATIAGAIVGATVANERPGARGRHRRGHPPGSSVTVRETRPVERCRTVERTRHESRLQHYEVTYRYAGRTATTSLPNDPGPRLELEVSTVPARY